MFTKTPFARNDIQLGIQGLLSGTSNDPESPLGIVSLSNDLHRSVPMRHTALVVRLKGDGEIKARLCLRGDTIGMRFSNFASAPIVWRSMVRILVSTAVANL